MKQYYEDPLRANDEYYDFLEKIQGTFDFFTDENEPLFTTNAKGLWEAFLNGLPKEARQHYNCNTCRHFVNKYGNLVKIDSYGKSISVFWHKAPEFFQKSVSDMKAKVRIAKVTGVFLSDNKILGTPLTGQWHHMAVKIPQSNMNKSRTLTAKQVMAEKREDFNTLRNALAKYDLATIERAVELLQSNTLYRSDKVIGMAIWFLTVYNNVFSARKGFSNAIWYAVAKAPEGYCHISSNVLGTLLDDIMDEKDIDDIKRRFEEKMKPSNYMRSKVAPTSGGVEQAEKVIKSMGLEDALKRRYATFNELPCDFIWKPTKKKVIKKAGGVFSNIATKDTSNKPMLKLPETVMTWEKFKRTVLPQAKSMKVKIEDLNRMMALVTAKVDTAPNILRWDNTFSWYYHGGVDAEIKRRVINAGGRYEDNDIRCSLIWNNRSDLDIHCITPSGEHIYWQHKRGYNNGWLDIDQNVHGETLTPVENIRWAKGKAEEGQYTFYVKNFTDRNHDDNPFIVELNINDRVYKLSGNIRGHKEKIKVFSFDYVRGQNPIMHMFNNEQLIESNWGVTQNDLVEVKGIINSPNLWGKQTCEQVGTHIFFLLDGCKDLSEGKGRGFFNEMLVRELRQIRKTLEAYTAQTPIEGVEDADACGVGFSYDNPWNLSLIVKTERDNIRRIKIDRWD